MAIYHMGNWYRVGELGFPQDYSKALELWHRAADLGYALAYNNIGYAYNTGRGVEVDMKKAIRYYELSAMGGNMRVRHNLASNEYLEEGTIDRALKHCMIAVRSGHSDSLEMIKRLYSNGHASKDDYMKALQLYQAYLGEIKSGQRDKAAAADDDYRYY